MARSSQPADARDFTPAAEAGHLHENAMQLTELMRDNTEAFVQAWSTTMRGMLGLQEHLLRFAAMRMQKDVEMGKALSECKDLNQVFEQQTAFGRTMVDDYMQESHDMLQSTLDVMRESWTPIEERADETVDELREAAA